MKITKIGSPRIVMANPDSGHNYFGWSTVTRLKNGRIALAASGFRIAHICPFGKAVLSFSDDEGETYTSPVPVIDTVLDDRDAGLCAFGKSGLIMTSFNNTVDMQRHRGIRTPEADAYLDTVDRAAEEKALGSEFRISLDNGKTWGAIHKSPVTSPHGPCELKSGKILWAGRLFDGCDRFTKEDSPFIRICEIFPDGSMTEIGHIDDIDTEDGQGLHFCEPDLFECESGKFLCLIRANTPFTTFQSESYDGGRSWTKAHPILAMEGGGAPAHVMRHSSGVLVCSVGYRKGPYGIKLLFSRDEGSTWEDECFLIDDSPSSDVGYPSTVELKDGSLLTAYYGHAKPGFPGSEAGRDPAYIFQQKWRMEE